MIVITTPTGDIGSQVLHTLLAQDPATSEALRVIVRDPAKLPVAVRERVDVISGSHGDPAVLDRAFADADSVFWLVPPDPQAPSLDVSYSGFARPAAAAFAAHGVSRVVGISALGRGTPFQNDAGLVTASLAMDDLIAESGVAYRALANASFMDNILRQVNSIRENGVFSDTQDPDRPAPLVATRDIAATAAALLLDHTWTGVDSVPLLGPADLSQNDMARIMSEVLNTPVRYERTSLDSFGSRLTGFGVGSAHVNGLVDMMRAKDQGLDDGIVRTADASSPTTFAQWCELVLKPAIARG